jgi:hypothetical protein
MINPTKQNLITSLTLALAFLSINACSTTELPKPLPIDTSTPQVNNTPATPTQIIPTATTAPSSIWIAPYLPSQFLEEFSLPSDLIQVNDYEKATVRIDIGKEAPISTWVFSLVASFATIPDGVRFADLQAIWQGKPPKEYGNQLIIAEENTMDCLRELLGNPSTKTVRPIQSGKLIETAWKEDNVWALIPFEAIEPRWKVLEIDTQSPLRKNFNLATYPLSVSISLTGNPDTVSKILELYGPDTSNGFVAKTNRDPEKLTTLILTGTTALVRGTAHTMEQNGMTYPDIDIRETLREADLLHVSNEIAYTPLCPPPFSTQQDLVFCSKPEYNLLLEDIGTDIIEMSGDHFIDSKVYDPNAVLYTIELYRKLGWKYYGGGVNLDDGRKPLLIEDHGNRLAFLGCNAKPPGYSGASLTTPGAVHCDFPRMEKDVRAVKDLGYLPIVTFQHLEYYSYKANPAVIPDFRMVAQAGAVIVSGSQAHQPQAIEFYEGAFIHYGLGNLFFDQFLEGYPQRQAFMDRHVFYDNKYLGTELLTILFIDFARPRPMTPAERQDLLQTVFTASGW